MSARSQTSYRKRAEELGKTVRPLRDTPAGTRYCPDCAQFKALDEFVRNRSAAAGRGSYCRPCHAARGKADVEQNHGSTRTYHLKRRYGLTAVEVDALVAAQGGVCAVCGTRPPEHVDHDHVTGKVRGVLCSCCNQGLGNVRDDTAALRAAIDDLEKNACP